MIEAERILRLPQVLARVGISRSELYRREALNQFPKRVKLGARSVGWLASEVQEFIEARIRESRASKPASDQSRAA